MRRSNQQTWGKPLSPAGSLQHWVVLPLLVSHIRGKESSMWWLTVQFVTHYAESSLCDQTGLILTCLKQIFIENCLDPQDTGIFSLSPSERKKRKKTEKERQTRLYMCSIDQYIHHCDSKSRLACDWPTVLDTECWLGNCALDQGFLSESGKPRWLIKPSHAHTYTYVHTHTHILSFWPIRVHIIGAAGFLFGREMLTVSEALCLCAACRPVFVVDLQFFVD